MKIAIRVDASTSMGLGHLVRCRTLAHGLRAQGAEVRFICRAHPGHQIDALAADAFANTGLPAPPNHIATGEATAEDDYARWLGVPQHQDAAETLAALSGWRPDWLLVDHYGLDTDWEHVLRPHVVRILSIDDLANRRHDCDLLLDQNYAPEGATRYQDLLPPGALTLLGPTYALLRPDYAQHRQTLGPRDGQVRRVLVFFGGTDPHNLSSRALTALSDPALAHLAVDLVIGANHPQRETLAAQAAARPNTQVQGPRPHLADLMAAADLAIGAGGATTWERCCLGLPSLVVSLADNQRPACQALAAAGVIRYLGHQDQLDVGKLAQGILELAKDHSLRRVMSEKSTALVDGQGVARVVHMMKRSITCNKLPRPTSGGPCVENS